MKKQENGLTGFRGKRRLFFKILGLMMALSLMTVLVFGVFINRLVLRNQKERINELNLNQLQRISSDVELIFDLLSQGMTRSMWSDDFINLMITPGQHNADLAYRVIKVLEDQVKENDLVRKSYLYLPFSDEVYVYSGTYMDLEYLGDREMVKGYLEIREQGRDPEATSEWKVYLYNRRIFLASDFCLPNFVGVMFYEINRQELYNIIQAENETFNTTIYVYDEGGNLLFDYMAGGLQPGDFSEEGLFLTAANGNSRGSYYMNTSKRMGWRYLVRVNPSESMVSPGTVMGILLPCIVFYILASFLFSVYVTQSVYSPINRLLQITTDPTRRKTPEKRKRMDDEVDFLELAWLDSLGQNKQHRELMGHISEDILEQVLRGILTGKDREPEALEGALVNIGREDLLHGYYVILALEIIAGEEEGGMVEQELYQRSLLKILEQLEQPDMTMVILPMEMSRTAVLLRFDSSVSAFQIRETAARLEEQVQTAVQALPYRVQAGRGNTCSELSAVQMSYYEAVENIRYQAYREDAPEGESAEQIPPEGNYYVKLAHQGYSLAEQGHLKEAQEAFTVILEEIRKREADPAACCEPLLDDMMEKLISCRVGEEEINAAGILQDIETCRRAGEPVTDGMEAFYYRALPLIWESSRKSNNHYVQKAREYIVAHYAEGTLSLQEIAETLGISSSYLSSIFTEGTGIGLNAWLNDYRVKQARRFLDETSLNISEIGYKCGFNSAQSFTRVFKKHMGMSPKQYRESPRERQGGV